MSHLGPQMSADSTKRSIVRSGQKTSVSLESEFWSCFREIAIQQKTNLSALVSQIDKTRNDANLSSAIRVFVLNHLRAQIADARPSEHDHRAAVR